MAEQEADESALRRIVDRQCDDPHLAPLEAANHFEQLTDPILHEDGELTNRRVVAPRMVE